MAGRKKLSPELKKKWVRVWYTDEQLKKIGSLDEFLKKIDEILKGEKND